MDTFQRAAIYADLADGHVIAHLDAVKRGDHDAAEQHLNSASDYFQAEQDLLCGVES